jgi:hypothetical protein
MDIGKICGPCCEGVTLWSSDVRNRYKKIGDKRKAGIYLQK